MLTRLPSQPTFDGARVCVNIVLVLNGDLVWVSILGAGSAQLVQKYGNLLNPVVPSHRIPFKAKVLWLYGGVDYTYQLHLIMHNAINQVPSLQYIVLRVHHS